jgi:beta-glucosidase
VQIYVSDLASTHRMPIRQLKGFARVSLKPGQKKTVRFTLRPIDMALVNEAGKRVVEPGEFRLSVGGGQPGARGTEDGVNVLMAGFEVTGVVREVEAY